MTPAGTAVILAVPFVVKCKLLFVDYYCTVRVLDKLTTCSTVCITQRCFWCVGHGVYGIPPSLLVRTWMHN